MQRRSNGMNARCPRHLSNCINRLNGSIIMPNKGQCRGGLVNALVQLRMVEIGNIVVRDVPALVHPDEALGVNLLGMSFLSRVRWTHERGKLILEQ